MPSRRDFLQAAAVAGSWSLLGRRLPLFAQENASASALVAGKSDRMEVLKAVPKVLQTPADALRDPMTASDLLFVRNNQDLDGAATMQPYQGDWNIELSGLLNRPARISLQQLRNLPGASVDMVLQCAGNRRAKFSEIRQTEGTQWGSGGIGNVTFGGVKLSTVLQSLGVEPTRDAVYIAAEGADGPPAGEQDFEHSIPLGDALETGIIAMTLNGRPLPRVHGGPVRLVLPGYYATVSLKWLTKLRFESQESRNRNHAARYRTPNQPIPPGSEYDFTVDNSKATWRMKIATMVTRVDRVGTAANVAGWAWNDGRTRISEVLASIDQGHSWQKCVYFPQQTRPYAWTSWLFQMNPNPAATQIWIRAVDAQGATQPLDGSIAWNPHGYEWNAVEKVVLPPAAG